MSKTATETRSVIVERDFAFAPEKIWRALTQPHLIAEWLMKNDFVPQVGHRFSLRMEPQPNWNGIIDCQVLAVDPFTTLRYTWGTMGMGSVVTFTLTPTDAGTHVRVEQAGFRADQEQNYRGAMYGWKSFMGKLENVVAGLV